MCPKCGGINRKIILYCDRIYAEPIIIAQPSPPPGTDPDQMEQTADQEKENQQIQSAMTDGSAHMQEEAGQAASGRSSDNLDVDNIINGEFEADENGNTLVAGQDNSGLQPGYAEAEDDLMQDSRAGHPGRKSSRKEDIYKDERSGHITDRRSERNGSNGDSSAEQEERRTRFGVLVVLIFAAVAACAVTICIRTILSDRRREEQAGSTRSIVESIPADTAAADGAEAPTDSAEEQEADKGYTAGTENAAETGGSTEAGAAQDNASTGNDNNTAESGKPTTEGPVIPEPTYAEATSGRAQEAAGVGGEQASSDSGGASLTETSSDETGKDNSGDANQGTGNDPLTAGTSGTGSGTTSSDAGKSENNQGESHHSAGVINQDSYNAAKERTDKKSSAGSSVGNQSTEAATSDTSSSANTNGSGSQ